MVWTLCTAHNIHFLGDWTLVRDIPDTKLLVSLNHYSQKSATMEIFDISSQSVKKIYSFDEVVGGDKSDATFE